MSNRNVMWQWVKTGIAVVCFIVAFMAWYGQKLMMGTRQSITDKESVNYSGSVTKEEAESLGKKLQQIGFFDGKAEKDVLYKKGDEGTIVSFVVQSGKWDDPEIVAGFEGFGREIASTVGGPPLTVRLIDDHLNTRKVLEINTSETVLKVSDQESLRYSGSVTEAEAQKVADVLKKVGYLDNSAPAVVTFGSEGDGYVLSFVVKQDAWNNQEVVGAFAQMGGAVAQEFPGKAVSVKLLDSKYQTQLTIPSKESEPSESKPAA